MEKLYEFLQQVDELPLTPSVSEKGSSIRKELEAYISHLIENDFEKLVDLLYRVDISEKKLKDLLAQQTNINSAALITDLIIERQLQKKALRQAQKPNTDIPEDERW